MCCSCRWRLSEGFSWSREKKFFVREETEELAGEEQTFNKQFLMVVSSESE